MFSIHRKAEGDDRESCQRIAGVREKEERTMATRSLISTNNISIGMVRGSQIRF
jgi:hypothetical protein